MRITLTVIAGPHQGLEFSFSRHDTFLVGRSQHAHFQLPLKDKYFSRVHFMVEVNPPQCRIIDMGSHNGTYVNGTRLPYADLRDGDQIRAGHTILKLSVHAEGSDEALSAPALTSASMSGAAGFTGLPEIPGYITTAELGRGCLGAVYLATRLADQIKVALKTIAPAAPGTTAHVKQFLDEAAVLTSLRHPHIVRCQQVGFARGFLYFVMDYVPGTDAGNILKNEGPFDIRRAVRLMCQVLDGLEYAQAKGLNHRDITPANVLLMTADGQELAKLSDFGIARAYEESRLSGLTMTLAGSSSVAFMPPEHITNFQGAAPHADQYSAAATLYTLLTGRHVIDLPKEVHRQLSSIIKSKPVPIQERRPDVGARLAAAIHKALSRNPGQRFADIATFRAALQAAV